VHLCHRRVDQTDGQTSDTWIAPLYSHQSVVADVAFNSHWEQHGLLRSDNSQLFASLYCDSVQAVQTPVKFSCAAFDGCCDWLCRLAGLGRVSTCFVLWSFHAISVIVNLRPISSARSLHYDIHTYPPTKLARRSVACALSLSISTFVSLAQASCAAIQ